MAQTRAFASTLPLGERERLRTQAYLDSKTRTIGIDKDGIEAQLQERERRAHAEAVLAAHDRDEARAIGEIVDAAEARGAAAKSAGLAGLAATWNVQRDLTLTREWDLNDPKRVTKDTLPRNVGPVWETSDFAPASSLQVRVQLCHHGNAIFR
jgi:hypothetical protein